MNIIHRSLLYKWVCAVLTVILLVSCQTPSTPEVAKAPTIEEITNIQVNTSLPQEVHIKSEDFPLPNCGGTSELNQTLGTQATVSKNVTIGAKAKTGAGTEIGISELAKLKLELEVELAYQETYESAASRLDTIVMKAAPSTHVIYVIGWYEQVFSSMVKFSQENSVYSIPYTYKLRVPKIDDSRQIPCQGENPPANDQAPSHSPEEPIFEPTITPEPTIEEQSNTPFGSYLKVGDTWKQDGIWLTLDDSELSTYIDSGEVWLSFSIANHTGDTISVSLDQQNIILETNTGTRFEQFGSTSDYRNWKATINNGEREEVWFLQSTSYSWLGDYFSPEVNYLLVTVRDWSRITEAVWKIEIQH